MEDDFPEQFRPVRQDYGGLKYPGDLPGDLGLVPAVATSSRNGRPDWRTGWTLVRWAAATAAAAVVPLAAIGLYRANSTGTQLSKITPAVHQPGPVAVAPLQPPLSGDGSNERPTAVARPSDAPAAIASITSRDNGLPPDRTAGVKPGGSESADDSIPLWSDVDVNASTSISTATAGLPATSLILPTVEEAVAEKSAESTVKGQGNSTSSL